MTTSFFEGGKTHPSLPTYFQPKSAAFSIRCNPGCHGPKSPVIGTHADELKSIYERIDKEPILRQFENLLYYQENSYSFNFLIPCDQKNRADEISRGIFLKYIEDYTTQNVEINEESIVDWCLFTQSPGQCLIQEEGNRNGLGWNVQVKVRQKGNPIYEENGSYLSPYLCALHEIQHVEDVPAFAPVSLWAQGKEKGSELKQTLKTLILSDEVYKQVNELGLFSHVDYGKSILLKGRQVSIGTVANFYRKLEERHLSLCSALLSQQSIEFLQRGGI
jgi:hypothetical protein